MAELVVELRSEEIPARMQAGAARDLQRLMEEALKKAGLDYESAACFVTPRRLALTVAGLPERQPDVEEEKRGPREGAPDQAIQGFLKGNGLESLEQAELRDTGKGNFWFAVKKIEGRPTKEVLPGLLEGVIRAMPWPKSMRWAEGEFRWVRPLRSILAVFDGKPLDGGLDLGGGQRLSFGATASGHPFMGQGAFTVTDFESYRKGLLGQGVVLDPKQRRNSIESRADVAAMNLGVRVKKDEGLLDEVVGLVEWPTVLVGAIDESFMDLPAEVLSTSMRSHQKYFSLTQRDGSLAPHFLLVADCEVETGSPLEKNIVAGNERVLRARLSDARFFWDQDRKRTLQSRVSDLKQVVFHAKLGTVEDKVDRITSLAVALAKQIEGAEVDRVRSAARLAKADLTTGMVGEFPELQGVMGRYYAKADKEHDEVAEAIAEHYSPLGPNDACPSAPTSVAVALADKLDTLVGFWAINELPTGSKDPYALRRAALGVIRLILENNLRLELLSVFNKAYDCYGSAFKREHRFNEGHLLSFFSDRLKVALKDQGVRFDLIAAVLEGGGIDDLVSAISKVQALQALVESEAGSNLLTAYRRAANIVQIEEKKDGARYAETPDASLFDAPEEKALADALGAAQGKVHEALEAEDFAAAMDALAALRGPVDAFFDKVTVNAEEASLRANRLRLLNAIKATLEGVADFSKIEG